MDDFVSKRRILHVVLEISPEYGGPGTVACEQARVLASRGHGVTLLSTSLGSASTKEFVDVHGVRNIVFPSRYSRLPVSPIMRGDFARRVSPELMRWISEFGRDYDVVHVHFGRDLILLNAVGIVQGMGVPTVLQPHGMVEPASGIRGIVDALLVKRLLRRARRLLALQEHERSALLSLCSDARVTRVPNFVNLTEIQGLIRTDRDAHRQYVLFAARLHPCKRVTAFVQMAALLERRFPDLDFRVLGADDGELDAALALATQLGIREKVAFEGRQEREDVLRAMAGAAAFVVPSSREAFPMALLEAMASGAPSVIVDTCRVADELDRSGAVVVTDGEPAQLAAAVEAILSDRSRATDLASRAQHLVSERFSAHAVVGALEDVYGSHEEVG